LFQIVCVLVAVISWLLMTFTGRNIKLDVTVAVGAQGTLKKSYQLKGFVVNKVYN